MAKISSIIIITFLILFISSSTTLGSNAREALEIIIGGGGSNPAPPPESQDCPPPPPPPCPPPPSPPHPPPPPKKSPPPPPKKSPPPPSPRPRPPPPPSPFESERLRIVYPVLQDFRKKVLNFDPTGIITKTWNGTDICSYGGLKCAIVPDFKQKALAGVKLNNFNLGGPGLTLNGFIDRLPDIAYFHANSNNFTGSIPTINKSILRFLYELDLSNNKLGGGFPYQVLSATNLVFLDLRFNGFAGLLPAQVFTLDLDLLFVNDNNFVQKLPDNLGSTPVLYLTLANNRFIGEIPHSIGKAANTLVEVLFLNNQLSGCLPYEIGLLKMATVFDVGSNNLTGPIPHSFQCLEKMELLNLARNKFYGAVPEAVCSLPKLQNFTVSYNYFTQVGPQCRKLIKDGVLNVRMNCILDLPNQRSPSDCAKFFSMTGYCPNEKSLSYVPCRKGGAFQAIDSLESSSSIETSDFESTTTPAPAPAPLTYGALSPSDR